MQVQTLANLRCVKFVLKLISPNIPNLNIKEASTSHEFKFILGTHLLLQHGTSEFLSLPLMADVVIFFFSTQFHKLKRYINFIRLIQLLLQKPLRFLNSSGRRFRQKNIHCKDCSSKLYFSKGIQNNRRRSNFHCYGYHKCYLRKPKGQKYNYPIQSNAYLGRSTFEHYLESKGLFQIKVYQISNIIGSKSLQKQNRIK